MAFQAGPKPCQCPRVFKSVGRENLTTMDDGWYKSNCPAGGEWYSHPKGGECAKGNKVGDGKSNCTYRLEGIAGAVNASCMYRVVDKAVEDLNPACFNACPQPHNVTSDCYLECYAKTS